MNYFELFSSFEILLMRKREFFIQLCYSCHVTVDVFVYFSWCHVMDWYAILQFTAHAYLFLPVKVRKSRQDQE